MRLLTNEQSLFYFLAHFNTQQNVLIENKKVMLSNTEKAELKWSRVVKQKNLTEAEPV